jgi:glutathione peroxidase-family protein
LTQGAEKERINRVHLFPGGAIDDAELLTKYDGTIFVSLANVDQLEVFGDESDLSRYIFLVDQIGNLMMRFPVDINPSLMKKDVTKLLKLSKGWKTVN